MRSYALKSTLIMLTIDFFFMSILCYALGLLIGVIPDARAEFLKVAALSYAVKTIIWLIMRVPLLLPIDRWIKRGMPADDNDPSLVRSIYFFPYDFSVFYGAIIFAYFAGMMLLLASGKAGIHLSNDMILPGMLFAGAIGCGAIAIGVPVNLLLTAKFSKRLSERKTSSFADIPGKQISLQKKMGTVALALGCAPSLLLFSFASFLQYEGLYKEAERLAGNVAQRLQVEEREDLGRWSMENTFPFAVEGSGPIFDGAHVPEPIALSLFEDDTYQGGETKLIRERRVGYVLRYAEDGSTGVLVRVPRPENNYLALTLIMLLACLWPLVTSFLTVQTIVKPVAVIAGIFHRIIGRGRTEDADTVPIFYKDEVGRLAYNANRTINIITEARQLLEYNARDLASKNRELKEAYRTKGEFLANMSHELRTPLNAIIGFSRLMKRKLKDTLPPRQKKNLDLIQQSGEQLLVLVNDLLDFEKIEAGKLTVRREEFELAPFFESLYSTLESTAQEKELELVFKTEDSPESISSDKERLRQILTNLITNSLKYSDEGKVVFEARQQEQTLVLTVSDEGIGMTAEQVERIFDPFHQVDGSETRERGGVGLGLAIVGRLVGLLRGQITVVSEKGVGSTFTVTLPLQAGTGHLKPEGRGAEVLIVDDNVDYLESMHNELTEAGFRVTVAESGKEALEKLETLSPSIILLDIIMPEMDGWQVLQEVRKRDGLGRVPVVITSVVDEKPTGLDLEVTGWLTKPFDFQSLKELLASQAANSEGVFEGSLLIVEDDPHTAQLLEQTFEESGIASTTVSTEKEALKILDEALPQAMILDLNLAQGSGWAVLAHLRTMPGHENTRVFVYTASDLQDSERDKLNETLVTIVHKHGNNSLSDLVGSILKDG